MAQHPACWHSDVNSALTGSRNALLIASVVLLLTPRLHQTKVSNLGSSVCVSAEWVRSFHLSQDLIIAQPDTFTWLSRWDTSVRLHHPLARLCLTTAPRVTTRGRAGDVCGGTSITFTHACVSSLRVVRQAACGWLMPSGKGRQFSEWLARRRRKINVWNNKTWTFSSRWLITAPLILTGRSAACQDLTNESGDWFFHDAEVHTLPTKVSSGASRCFKPGLSKLVWLVANDGF